MPGAEKQNILPGAYSTDSYLPLLVGKRVAVLTNHTALVEEEHLIDLLLRHKISVVKIFGPEHGFRGDGDDGAAIANAIDSKTGIPAISLWGDHYKPTPEELSDADILVFDIQDVGCRFFTYTSSLQWFMEAAAENNKPLIILDRPNPNGFYIDGPLLEKEFNSHLGQNPVPIVYGMTIGEYALMLAGEQWLRSEEKNIDLTVIPCKNYTHDSLYKLPVRPSPNLPDMTSVYLYPSTCFFEGTACSIGRGTDKAFRVFGHPSFPPDLYSFTPIPMKGATDPKFNGQTCYGYQVAESKEEALIQTDKKIRLHWLIKAYGLYRDKENFFDGYLGNDNHFDLLAGNRSLREAITEGQTEEEMRASWQEGIEAFKRIRNKYLLYPDFKES
ncbi:MAG: DUF1343 domain-containing protein [Chitinophagaceae bacterium]|nr:DUF1343 domain-containing protein [Chitinophagaceae bacterium]